MQVNINQKSNPSTSAIPRGGKVVLDPNPVRIREMLDQEGNVINPRTKEIIRKVEDNQ